MYTRFGEVKFEFPALAALKSEHQGHHFLVPIISRDWPPLGRSDTAYIETHGKTAKWTKGRV